MEGEKVKSRAGHADWSFATMAWHEIKEGPVSRGSTPRGMTEQEVAVIVLCGLRMNEKKAPKNLEVL